MKKAGVWILIVCLLVVPASSVWGAGTLNDLEGSKYRRAVEELVNLNIMQGYEDGTFRPDNPLTRAEFAALVIRVLGLEDSASVTQSSGTFVDVPTDNWAAGYIYMAAGMGIINGNGDGTFSPDENVTFEQACKMILESMGYGIVAAENGGYPQGYIAAAAQSGISRDVNAAGAQPLTRGETAQMLMQALDVEIIEKNYGTDTYARQDGVTLRTRLCERLNLERKKGIVTGNAFTNLDGTENYAPDSIIIDGERYWSADEELQQWLGRCVEYYAKTNSDGADTLYSIRLAEQENGMVTFLPEEVEELSGDSITVYPQESAKEQQYRLDAEAKTVYNGKYAPEMGTQDWAIQNGRLTLLDNNGDKRYDIVFVEEIQTFFAADIDAEKEVINLQPFSAQSPAEFRGRTFIDCGDGSVTVRIYGPEWESTRLSAMEGMQMIGVMESADKELVTILEASPSFSGTVESVNENDSKVVIDGESYYLAKNENGALLVELKPGDEGAFWLDAMGRIAGKNIDRSSAGYGKPVETVNKDLICSYLLAADSEGDFTPVVYFKLLTNLLDGTREERVFELAENVTLDGEKMEAGEILSAIAGNNSGDYHVPLVYELNGKGKIRSIRTYRQTIPMGYMTYQSSANSFDGLYYLDDNSITYFVDVRDHETVYEKADVKLNNGTRYQVRIFDPSGEGYSSQKRIFVVYMDLENAEAVEADANAPMLVSDVIQYDAGDGMAEYMLEGLCAGEPIQMKLSDDVRGKAAELRTGSLIRFSKNGLGELKDIKILAQLPPDSYYRKGIGGDNEQVFGNVVSAERNSDYSSCILTVQFEQAGSAKQASYEIAGKPVYLLQDGKVSMAETGELGEAEQVFLNVVNFDVKAVIIIR